MSFLKSKGGKTAGLILIAFITSLVFVKGSTPASAWSLLPPAIAIFLAFVSGRLSVSLGAAIFMGGFLNHYGETQQLGAGVGGALSTTLQYFVSAISDPTNLKILGFVFFILSMVHLMTVAGGLHALVHKLQNWIVGPRSAQLVTAILGCLIFIDDYANTMIVGSTMKKVTDRYGISREKLAFLVDATSAPIAGIALVSTWIGYEVGLFSDMSKNFGWEQDGYAVFLDAIPFRFYCFLMLAFVFINIFFGIDYGSMKDAKALPLNPDDKDDKKLTSAWIALAPLGFLLVLVFSLLWRDGGGLAGSMSPLSISDWREVLTASENGIGILLLSSMICYGLTVVLSFLLGKISLQTYWNAILYGVKSAGLPIIILILAWSLKLVCDDLKTGEFIVNLLGNKVNAAWLPLSVFVVAALTAFSTGTSWGTMAILIPTVTPLAVAVGGGEYGLFVALCLAAILDGAIMGDHCSPISDTTIMSSISTDCDLLSHVRTQLPYSLTVGAFAIIFGYIPAGFGWPLPISIGLSLLLLVSLFFMLKKQSSQRRGVS